MKKQIFESERPESAVDAGWIWDIKKYALHDGPGIRTTVFFKGCPLRCPWCCNPESQGFKPEIIWIKERCIGCNLCLEACAEGAVILHDSGEKSVDLEKCTFCGQCVEKCPGEAFSIMGRLARVDDILYEISKDSVFFSRSGGGLTLSGGEPAAQPDFAAEILRRYKAEEGGLNTAVETSGFAPWESLEKIIRYTDLLFLDIKHMDSIQHKKLTGVGNELILRNAEKAAECETDIVIRLPLIPGANDSLDNVRLTAEFASKLNGVNRLDLLPYHRLGEPKYRRLGREYMIKDAKPQDLATINRLKSVVEEFGLTVLIGG